MHTLIELFIKIIFGHISTGCHNTMSLGQFLQILNILISCNSLFPISAIKSFEIVFQFIDLIIEIIVLFLVTVSLFINVRYKLVYFFNYLLFYTSPTKGKSLFDWIWCFRCLFERMGRKRIRKGIFWFLHIASIHLFDSKVIDWFGHVGLD